jgi:hypothetical protein
MRGCLNRRCDEVDHPSIENMGKMHKRNHRSAGSGLIATTLLLLTALRVDAGTYTWTGAAGDNNYSNPTNWSPQGSPGLGDNVIFNIDAAPSSGTAADVTNTASLLISQTLFTTGPAFDNSGTIVLATTADLTTTFSGTETLSGGGLIMLEGNASLYSFQSGTLVNQNNTICGDGSMFTAHASIVNDGTISADSSDGSIYINAPNQNFPFINNGTISASSGGTFYNTGIINNTNGSVVALDGGTVLDGRFIGGTFSTVGSGQILAGSYSSGGLTLIGAINNLDQITVEGSPTSPGSLRLFGPPTIGSATASLSGGGSISLDNYSELQIQSSAGFVNVDNTIEGSGTLTATSTNVFNQGTLSANTSGATLTIAAAGSTTFSNTGTLEAAGGGNLAIACPINNAGGVVAAKAGSTVTLSGSGALTGGTIMGSGTIAGSLKLAGMTVAPGDSSTAIGALTLSNGTTDSPTQAPISGKPAACPAALRRAALAAALISCS